MTKEDIKRKFCSRKFWVAIVGLITGLLLLFGVDADQTEKIGGIILTAGSIVAYILGEGLADTADTYEITAYGDGKPPDEDDGK